MHDSKLQMHRLVELANSYMYVCTVKLNWLFRACMHVCFVVNFDVRKQCQFIINNNRNYSMTFGVQRDWTGVL